MPSIHKKAFSKHSPEQLFTVVNDVSRYPEFIEWCEGADILKQTESILQATLYLRKKLLKHQFTTENTLNYPDSMHMRLLSGPFKQFLGEWRFQQGEQMGCEVEFRLHYEFSNSLLEMTIGKIFFHMADEMVQIFLNRAESLHG